MEAVARAQSRVPVAPALPAEAPLAMPVQSLRAAPKGKGRPATSPPGILGRRLFVIGGAGLMAVAAAREMYLVLSVGGLSWPEGVVLALFVLLSAWISFSFTSAVGGAFSLLRHGGGPLGIDPADPLPILSSRTALLMPTYNEPPERVLAGLQAIIESIETTGRIGHFDIFILSDTTDADIWVREEAGYLALRERVGGQGRIFYRRRAKNIDRKAGNIGEWVTRFGTAYDSMLVLDADSLMTGDSIVRLAAAMERHPGVGLIQTLPAIIGGRTLFARVQQFAGRLYGPLLAHGLAWWHGSEGNYWGHNAIIRTRAFAEQAGLPHLKGRSPFGGHILSHDFIEAALIRRGGWAVHMVPWLEGSYEEGPPSLTDLAVRDRRWCQGNLQHAAVLPAKGLTLVSRLHLLTGIGCYITAPLWLAMLFVGLLISVQGRYVPPDYFPEGFALFPSWPAQDPVRAAWVFAATMGILLAPKVISYVLMLFDRRRRQGFGAVAAFFSMLVETVLSGLLAPVMMLIQSGGVVGILAGRDAGWQPQRRDDGSVPFLDLVSRYGGQTLLGVFLGAVAYLIAAPLFWWMSPVILGLVLSVPLAALTATRSWGAAFRRVGLLVIPEERHPPEVMVRAGQLVGELAEAGPAPSDAIARLAREPDLLAAHRAFLPLDGNRPHGDHSPERLVARAKIEDAPDLQSALKGLTPKEKAAALGDAEALERLMKLAG